MRLSGAAGAVVGVAGGDRLGAEELFGQHHADEHVRPGERAQAEQVVGAREDRAVQALGATDEEGERAGLLGPGEQAGGQDFAGGRGFAEIECDDGGGGGECVEDGLALATADFAGAAAGFGELGDLEFGAEPVVVAGEQLGLGAAADPADGDQAPFSQGALPPRRRVRDPTCVRGHTSRGLRP